MGKNHILFHKVISRLSSSIKGNNLAAVLDGLDQDLKTVQITTEVFAIVQALK